MIISFISSPLIFSVKKRVDCNGRKVEVKKAVSKDQMDGKFIFRSIYVLSVIFSF